MQQPLAAMADAKPPAVWVDRLMRGIIFGGGALVFALLAWGHLGLGTWLFPPAPSPMHQVAQAGAYTVTFQASSTQLTARGPNAVTFTVRDAAGHAIDTAAVQLDLVMATMPMSAPSVTAMPQSTGSYLAHPIFGMAGIWKMNVTIAALGQPTVHTTFQVSVRW